MRAGVYHEVRESGGGRDISLGCTYVVWLETYLGIRMVHGLRDTKTLVRTVNT